MTITKNFKKMKLALLLVFNIYIFTIQAQITESYYADDEPKGRGIVEDHITVDDHIIFCGSTFDNYPKQPFITKIDTLGNIIWTTTKEDTDIYNGATAVNRIFKSGNYIYGLMTNTWPFTDNDTDEVWKVNANSGEIIWKQDFYVDIYRHNYLMNYDESSFLMGYFETTGVPKFAFLSKENGDTISTHAIGFGNNLNFGLAVNSDLDICYSHRDSLYKVSGADPEEVIWSNALPSSDDIVDYLNIYIDPLDSIYLFSRFDDFAVTSGYGKIIGLNTLDGTELWQTEAPGAEVESVAYLDDGDYIVSTWANSTTGGGQFWTSKINKLSGEELWVTTNLLLSTDVTPAAALSIDLDDNGDLFLTGFFNDSWGPRDWGIVKLNGATGDVLFEHNVSIDNLYNDDFSNGKGVSVIQNKPYFVGELQVGDKLNETKVCFVALDSDTGEELIRKFPGGSYQFPSRTLQVDQFDDDKTLVSKQIGRFTGVELYDFNNILLWENSFRRSFMLFGNCMESTDDEVVLGARSSVQLGNEPYYSSYTDSLFVFFIDDEGNLTNEYSFNVSGQAEIHEIIKDEDDTFIFYNKNDKLFARKIDNDGLSTELFLGVNYYPLLSQTKYTVDYSDELLFVFGRFGVANKLKVINKGDMSVSETYNLPWINKINYVLKNDPDQYLLCGQNEEGEDMLAKFDVSIMDSIWTKSYDIEADMYKIIFDEEFNFVYSVGTVADDVVLRKISPADGEESWAHTYDGLSNLVDIPADVSYDNFRDQITITGYQTDNFDGNISKNVFIETVDDDANLIQTIVKQGEFEGDNIGLCIQTLFNGSVWSGGNLNQEELGLAGYVFEADTALICQEFQTVSVCDSLVSPSGEYTWYESGVYTDVIEIEDACDTVVIMNLNINNIDLNVVESSTTLTASEIGASYQWLDCGNDFAVLGETGQLFSPLVNGNYAVEITKVSCVDTTACYEISGIGITENDLKEDIYIYPNPTKGLLNIDFTKRIDELHVNQISITGNLIKSSIMNDVGNHTTIELVGEAGIYFLKLTTKEKTALMKVIKK